MTEVEIQKLFNIITENLLMIFFLFLNIIWQN